jgi:iron-sulfur cluster repair protein YtfE (RIC family)
MAKRHHSLVPLSQDHHHGLALALRLRQGDKALLQDGWTHDRAEQARRVQQFYERELRSHFQAEEEAVFPVLKEHSRRAGPLVDTLLEQHRAIEQLVRVIAQAKGDELERSLVALGEVLEQHIRLEERELFELYQSDLSPQVMESVGEGVRRAVASRT